MFHKSFGKVEVVSQDAIITIINIKATGEQKKLATAFANLSDTAFVKPVAKKKVTQRELTVEEEAIVVASVNKQMKEVFVSSRLTKEERLSNARYRQAGSSLRKF